MGFEQRLADGKAEGDPSEDESRAWRTLRRRVDRQLNPRLGLTPTAWVLIVLILAATVLAIVETEPLIAAGRVWLFVRLELAFAFIFSVEYALRLWCAPEHGESRLRFIRSPSAIIDLIAILGSLLPAFGGNTLLLRMVRVVRLARIAKLGRFSKALALTERAIRSRASHLAVALVLFLFFLVISASLIFVIEGQGQPEKFGSIPRAMWWTAVTMTTVGYGDVVPVTGLGKLMAAIISMGGIVLIAIPTGIMAASFSDELAREEAARAKAAAEEEANESA